MKTHFLLIGLIGLLISCASPTENESASQKNKKNESESKAVSQGNQQSKAEEFNKRINMECLKKSYVKHDEQEYIRYKFRITNKTEKKVKSLKGNITFTNKQGHEIKTFPMAYEEPIKGGEEVIWDTETVFDQFMDDEEALKDLNLKKLDCHWEPLQISFADGSVVK